MAYKPERAAKEALEDAPRPSAEMAGGAAVEALRRPSSSAASSPRIAFELPISRGVAGAPAAGRVANSSSDCSSFVA